MLFSNINYAIFHNYVSMKLKIVLSTLHDDFFSVCIDGFNNDSFEDIFLDMVNMFVFLHESSLLQDLI